MPLPHTTFGTNENVLIMTLFSTLFGARAKETANVTVLTAVEFKSAIHGNNIQLVDVRTAREFRSGHIKKALNVDFFVQSKFRDTFEKMNKSKPLYIYCRSGNRSQKAARMLSQMGFQEIYDLKGGYLSWD